MKDMVEKIRCDKFEPNPPSDSRNIYFFKIFFGQNFINKKLHFSDQTGLKLQVSMRFSKDFLLHRPDLVARYILVKKNSSFQQFLLIKFSKFETGFFSKKIWLWIYWCILHCMIYTQICQPPAFCFHGVVVRKTLCWGMYFAILDLLQW